MKGTSLARISLSFLALVGASVFASAQISNQTTDELSGGIVETSALNVIYEWNRTWNSSGYEAGYAVHVDSNGAIFVAGRSTNSTMLDKEMLLVKYSSSGSYSWVYEFKTAADEECFGLTTDGTGDIYLAGYTDGLGAGNKDMLIVKVSAGGIYQWNLTWGYSGDDVATAIEITPDGDIIVGGWCTDGANGVQFCAVKFYGNKTQAWNATWGGTNDDYCNDLKIDQDMNVYLAGTAETGSEIDMAVVKLNSSGNVNWSKTWGNPSYEEECNSIALASNGDIFLAGTQKDSDDEDALMVKLNSTGDHLADHLTAGLNGNSTGMAIAIDPDGFAFMAGNITVNENKMLFQKYDSTGTLLWQQTYGYGNGDEGNALDIDTYGNIYLTGTLVDVDSVMALTKFDNAKPQIVITGPFAGVSFKQAPDYVIIVDEAHVDEMWYTLNGGSNTSITEVSGQISASAWDALLPGAVNLTFWVNDTAGNTGSVSVSITKVNKTGINPVLIATIAIAAGGGAVLIIIIVKKREPDEPKVIDIT
ncbi:MAG: hypothetical protein ACTSUE_24380 [Promethearchaeota archaeon]